MPCARGGVPPRTRPIARVTRKVVASRADVEGWPARLHLRQSVQEVTDAAGLTALGDLWDRVVRGAWLDRRSSHVPGRYRSCLMIVELWIALLFYGGGLLDDVAWLARRGIREFFGWRRVRHARTLGSRVNSTKVRAMAE